MCNISNMNSTFAFNAKTPIFEPGVGDRLSASKRDRKQLHDKTLKKNEDIMQQPMQPVVRPVLKKKMESRSVSFELDNDGENVKVYVDHSSSVIVLTEEEKQSLWWSAVETAVMAEKLRLISLYYHKHKGEYKANFVHLFLRCSRSSINHEEGIQIVPDERGRRSARGLERHINEILCQYRSKYVKTILDIQSKMPPSLSYEIKAKLLKATSSKLTKPSRNLARFLAYEDQTEVFGGHRKRHTNKINKLIQDFHDSGINTV